jgi:Lamin Tail Domain
LQRLVGKRWVTVQKTTVKRATATLKPSGAYAFAVAHKSSRVFHYRAVVKADAGRLQVISSTRKVMVYDAAITGVSRSADEYVVLKNTGRSKVNMQGWKLTNKKGAAVTLPKRFIKPGRVLRIHTGKGRSNLTNLFLGRRAMFSNSHDRVTLVDRSSFRVSRLTF